MSWAIGDRLISQAELLLIRYSDRGSEVWKQGKQPMFPMPFGLACLAVPEVREAYEQRNVGLLYTHLFWLVRNLPRLRALGRAMIFLEWRLNRPPRQGLPLRKLLDDAQYFGLSEATLDRAKQRLPEVRAIRQGGLGKSGRWYWRWDPRPAAQRWLDEKEKAEEHVRQIRQARDGPQLPLPLDSR